MKPSRSQLIPEIIGEKLKDSRESKGLSRSELAGFMCLSAKHIEQLEEGGESSFYSKSHKVQVAKKVADHLGLTHESILEGHESSQNESSSKADKSQVERDLSTASNLAIPDVEELNSLGSFSQEPKAQRKSVFSKVIFALGLVLIGFFVYQAFSPSPSETYQNASLNESKLPAEGEKKVPEVAASEVKAVEKKTDNSEQSASDDPCLIPVESVAPFIPTKASYYGNFVYLVSRTAQKVCVIDSKGKKQSFSMALGETKNVMGSAPFTILVKDFSQLSVYFQGWRAIPSSKTTSTLKVQEAVASEPSPTVEKKVD